MQPHADASAAILSAEGGQGTATGTARFSKSLPVLAGHFPGNPLIPGVHVVALIAEIARRTGVAEGVVHVLEKVKWSAPVYPEDELKISLRTQRTAAGWRVDGDVKKSEVVCMTCRLLMR